MTILSKKNQMLFIIVLGGLLLMALPFTGISLYLVTFLFLLIANVALTVGWNIMGGYAGYVSFGHVAFVGTGGYIAAILLTKLGWSPLFTAPIAGLFVAVMAIMIGYPCLRLRGPYFSLLTLIIALVGKVVVLNLPGINTAAGIFVPQPAKTIYASRLILYEAMTVVLLITVIVAYLIENSRFGIGLKAIREDEEVAETQGINVTRVKMVAFAVSAGLAGLAGGIYSWFQGFLFPEPMFSIELSVMIVLMALLGGTNTWVGPLIGALVVSLIRELLTLYVGSSLSQIVFGVMLVVVILYLPNGLMGLFTERSRLVSRIKTFSGGTR